MVELTYLAIIGIVFAAMFFGYGFGLFEGRSQGYKKRKAEESKEKEGQTLPEPQTVKEKETVMVTVDDPGLLRLKSEGGSYTLDLDGARLNPVTLLPEQRKRLIEILTIIRPWLEGKPAPAVKTSAAAPSELDRLQAVSSPAPANPAPSTPVQPAPPLPAPPAVPPPATAAKEDRPAAPPNSIVAQIDSILQARLVGTPLAERGIFLAQSPQGGVIVYVGSMRYESVEEVPDPAVKAIIRAATSEWEDKYTPGLR